MEADVETLKSCPELEKSNADVWKRNTMLEDEFYTDTSIYKSSTIDNNR